jgi:hypothetical protein
MALSLDRCSPLYSHVLPLGLYESLRQADGGCTK